MPSRFSLPTDPLIEVQLPNVDPDNAEADKAVPYKIIAKYRRVDPAVSLHSSSQRHDLTLCLPDSKNSRQSLESMPSRGKNVPSSALATVYA